VIQFQTSHQDVYREAFDHARHQLRRLVETHPDFYPMYTMQGKWRHSGEAWTHWCDGFLPGMLWIVYGRQPQTSAEARWWREQAIR